LWIILKKKQYARLASLNKIIAAFKNLGVAKCGNSVRQDFLLNCRRVDTSQGKVTEKEGQGNQGKSGESGKIIGFVKEISSFRIVLEIINHQKKMLFQYEVLS